MANDGHGKRWAAGTALIVGSALLAACGAGGATGGGSGTGGEGQTLTVLVEGGGKTELQPVADLWSEETGNSVTFVELPYDGLYDRISTELNSGNVSADVIALDAIWLPAFVDGLDPLDDLLTDDLRDNLFPALIEESTIDGTVVGLPAWTNAEVLLYRTDLFEDPDQQSAFEAEYGYPLAPPTTWAEYRDVATFFTQDQDGDGTIDLYGSDVKGAVETEWLALVLQAGADGVVLDGDGNVIIDDPHHLAALDAYTELLNDPVAAPSGSAQMDWAAAQNLFYQGQTAMTRFWAHAYSQVPEESAVYGNVGVVPMPAGEAGIAGIPGAWYLSVPAKAPDAELGRQFISFALEHNELGLDTDLGLAATRTALESKAGEPGGENLDALIQTLDAPATQARPANAKWQQIVDTVLIPMLQKATAGGSDHQALLDDAKQQIEAIIG